MNIPSIIQAKLSRQSKDQHGLASIIVVFMLVILISLISLGFSRLMDRALRTASDKQLGAAADYAAQSGLNDTISYLKSLPSGTTPPGGSATDCSILVGTTGPLANSSNISGDLNTKYTCVLVDPTPPDLAYQNLPPFNSQVVKLTTLGGTSINSLMFSWQTNNTLSYPGFVGSLGTLFDESTWNSPPNSYSPVLRITLYPMPDAATGTISSSQLQTDSLTYYLYPSASASPIVSAKDSSSTKSGSILDGKCNQAGYSSISPYTPSPTASKYFCNVIISNLNRAFPSLAPAASPTYYYARITPLYSAANVGIQAFDSSNSYIKFQGVQDQVDVTAKANDAVKRIQARVAVGDSQDVTAGDNNIPEYTIRSANTICKRLLVPGSPLDQYVFVDPANTAIPECNFLIDTLPAPKPILLATPKSLITGQSTKLTWSFDPTGGPAVSCAGTSTEPAGAAASDVAAWNKAQSPGGGVAGITLTLNTAGAYAFTLTCTNPTGSGPSQQTVTVVPPCPAPVATTGTASGIGDTSAYLDGTVNPNTCVSFSYFNWGLTATYGNKTPNAGPLALNTTSRFTPQLTGLTASTTYHFQICATYTPDQCGLDASFTTAATGGGSGGSLPNCSGGGSASPSNIPAGGSFSYSGVWSHCYGGAVPFGSISCCSIGWNGPNSTDGSDNNIGFSGSGKGGGSGGWGGIRGIGNGNGGSFDIPVYENPPGGGGGGGGGSCSNGANDYPTCTNCTVSTDTNYNTGPCSGTCSNGAIDYSTCVTFGGGCFTAGTNILTPYGQEPIEKLKPGDVVETWDTTLNKMVESPVVNTYSHKDIPTFLVITTSGLVNTTSDHRFWTGNMWMEAGRLIAGSSYLFDSNGHKQRVLLTMNGSTQSVYNLQVASSNHDYFANGYLVHNIKLL